MARGIIRQASFSKLIGAYRSQWKRFLLRLFIPFYGKRGVGWFSNPKKALYNWWYNRSSVSIARLLGYKPSWATCICAFTVAAVCNVCTFPVDVTKAGIKANKIRKARKASLSGSSSSSSSSGSGSAGLSTNSSHSLSSSSGQRIRSDGIRSLAKSSSTLSSLNSSVSGPGGEKRSKQTSPTTTVRHVKPSPEKKENETEKKKPSSAKSSVHLQSPTKKTEVKTERKTSLSSSDFKSAPSVKKEHIEPAYTFAPAKLYPEKAVPSETTSRTEPTIMQDSRVDQPPVVPDETAPKSKPKNSNDQYIRKRMIIAGSSYCDKDVLEKLSIGSYIEIIPEPDNPYDKDAVMLQFDGRKIGYISRQDKLPYVACLRLKRKVYGVITDIDDVNSPTKYEFETWFDLG